MPALEEQRDSIAFPHLVMVELQRVKSPAEALDFLCRQVEARLPGHLASVFRVGADDKLDLIASPSAPPELFELFRGIEPGLCAGTCGTAVFTGEPVLVEDTLSDDRWAEMRPIALEFNIRSSWSVPVCVEEGVVRGTFNLGSARPGLPNAEELELLRTASYLTGVIFAFGPSAAPVSEARQALRLLSRLRVGFIDTDVAERITRLSPRERDVLRLVGEGLPSKLIARSLHISEHTVANHRASMLRKLEAEGPAELTRIAVHAALAADLPHH